MTKDGGGRSIYAKQIGTVQVRCDPRKEEYFDEKKQEKALRTVYVMLTMKVFKRLSQAAGLRGMSSKMTPGRPTDGSIGTGTYGQRIDGFANGCRRSKRLFSSRRTVRWGNSGVSKELQEMAHQGSILYMPGAGKLTCQGVNSNRLARVSIRGNYADGYQLLDADNGWMEMASCEALELIAKQVASVVSETLT